MNWYYSYTTWLVPVRVLDEGFASVQVEGLEVGLTLRLTNDEGSMKLSLLNSSCDVKNITKDLDGGTSLLHQGLVIIAMSGSLKSELLEYTDGNAPLAETDLDRIEKLSLKNQVRKDIQADVSNDMNAAYNREKPSNSANLESDNGRSHIERQLPNRQSSDSVVRDTQKALKMSFTLSSSCFATMAIGELLKTSTCLSS
ncbi:hypothetical protein QQ045_007109 [Rhodiola kirilowii]